MSPVLRSALVAVFLLLPRPPTICLNAASRPASATQSPPAAVESLDATVARELKARGGIGASVALVEHGRIVLAKAYGRRSLEATDAATGETPFAIGSVTKQFTSAAVLLLAEDGKLSVEDKVAKYYPDLTRASGVSLLDLMNHVSGYRDYYPLDFVDRRLTRPIAADALLHDYAGAPLDFDPGTRWSYSNTGFILLGRIVEKVSGRPFGDFLTERILGPLGMRHTFYEPDPDDRRLAQGYTSFALTPFTPAVHEGRGWIASAGGLYSTARDLATWDLALMEGRVLKPDSWNLMITPRRLSDGTSAGYGCGLGVTARAGTTVLSHGGAVSGFLANNTMVPATKSAFVVLLNDEDAGLMSSVVRRAMDDLVPTPPGSVQANQPAVDRAPKIQIEGAAPADAARQLFTALQRGEIDRATLGSDFNEFLTAAKLAAAARSLAPFGAPAGIDVRSVAERGGMQVASVRLTFASGALDALMYRTPDGKVQEFLITRP